jgi:hypothetical protein
MPNRNEFIHQFAHYHHFFISGHNKEHADFTNIEFLEEKPSWGDQLNGKRNSIQYKVKEDCHAVLAEAMDKIKTVDAAKRAEQRMDAASLEKNLEIGNAFYSIPQSVNETMAREAQKPSRSRSNFNAPQNMKTGCPLWCVCQSWNKSFDACSLTWNYCPIFKSYNAVPLDLYN